jgi:cytochrome c-type biogenesis protein CcmH
MRKWLVFLILLPLLATVNQVQAQEPTPIPDDLVNQVAKDMYCPVCENVPLDVCPTKACAQWRELIREKLALGWSKDQIETFFADQYGEKVLAVPPAAGLNWAIYVIPPLFLILGLILVLRFFRKSKTPPHMLPEQEHHISSDLLKKVEDDLKEDN